MKRSLATLAATAFVTVALVGAAGPPHHNAGSLLRPRVSFSRPVLADDGIVVTARDDERGLPSFAWATHIVAPPFAMGAERAAAWHLARLRTPYRLTSAALATAHAVHVHDVGRGGVVVTMRQSIGGVDVMLSDVKVLMRPNLELVAIGGGLHPHATGTVVAGFKLNGAQAAALALHDATGVSIASKALRPEPARGAYARFRLSSPSALELSAPARVKPVYFPLADRLVPAYYVEVFVEGPSTTTDYALVVAADDGTRLFRKNLTASDTFDLRVWADTVTPFAPLDGPHENYTPHPTAMPDGVEPAAVPSVLLSVEGLNTNPNNVADPWLEAGATESRGNNVDAYVDREAPDGFSGNDFRAAVVGGTLDYTYDLAMDPRADATQSMAAVTQLFYVNNWLHDWFYDSGFNEGAGNAQLSNFGRGGEENDVLLAQAQDYSGTNNANMSTPADGQSPRMQMYTWSARSTSSLEVSTVMLTAPVGVATFGPQSFDVTAGLAIVDDGTGAPSDACEPIQNDVVGAIALADRGNCSFWEKAAQAESAGAVGLIIANNTGTQAMNMPGTPGVPISIPLLSVSLADGDALDVALAMSGQAAHMVRDTGPDRDSSLDNGIVAHEWGHFLHHRLTQGSSRATGAMSEGWGDFLALYTLYGEGEDVAGTYAAGIYAGAASENAAYFGIRRFPYSIDVTKNALSFRHISVGEILPTATPSNTNSISNAEVHNAGEVWASALWEAYAALIGRTLETVPPYDFVAARRRMADYVVGGMMLMPAEATFTEARDALLAAAHANDASDALAMAEAFAVRGMGTCAVAPARFSNDFVGLTEGFVLAPRGDVVEVSLDDQPKSCDQDGFLDAGETGTATIRVANTGFVELTNATVSLTAVGPMGVTVGASVTISSVLPFAEEVVEIPVHFADDGLVERAELALTATLSAPDACAATVEKSWTTVVHADEALASSTIESVDTVAQVWVLAGVDADARWSREKVAAFDAVWHGVDFGAPSDTAIESPDLMVHPSDDLTLDLEHAYSFEGTPAEWFDGGVIEITRDGGASWEDVSGFADPGYDGVISSAAGNVLAGRSAFSGDSVMYPVLEALSINLGTAFAGETIRIRFRIGTDQALDGDGWFIDNIALGGIVNTPFPVQVEDSRVCNFAPFADAGVDRDVEAGDVVALDASASSDPEGDPLSFNWLQVNGLPEVALSNANLAESSFVAPNTDVPLVLTFRVSVSDGSSSATDDVSMTVRPPTNTGGGSSVGGSNPGVGVGGAGGAGGEGLDEEGLLVSSGGCGCRVEAEGESKGWVAWLVALALVRVTSQRRKRRSLRPPRMTNP